MSEHAQHVQVGVCSALRTENMPSIFWRGHVFSCLKDFHRILEAYFCHLNSSTEQHSGPNMRVFAKNCTPMTRFLDPSNHSPECFFHARCISSISALVWSGILPLTSSLAVCGHLVSATNLWRMSLHHTCAELWIAFLLCSGSLLQPLALYPTAFLRNMAGQEGGGLLLLSPMSLVDVNGGTLIQVHRAPSL